MIHGCNMIEAVCSLQTVLFVIISLNGVDSIAGLCDTARDHRNGTLLRDILDIEFAHSDDAGFRMKCRVIQLADFFCASGDMARTCLSM